MPMFTTLRMARPVWPRHSPVRTRRAKSAILSSTACTRGMTSTPSTTIDVSAAAARRATCSTARSSVTLIGFPANMSSVRWRRPAASARSTSSRRVWAVTRFFDQSRWRSPAAATIVSPRAGSAWKRARRSTSANWRWWSADRGPLRRRVDGGHDYRHDRREKGPGHPEPSSSDVGWWRWWVTRSRRAPPGDGHSRRRTRGDRLAGAPHIPAAEHGQGHEQAEGAGDHQDDADSGDVDPDTVALTAKVRMAPTANRNTLTPIPIYFLLLCGRRSDCEPWTGRNKQL